MKKFGIVIICVVVACVLLGLSVPSYVRIKDAVEDVEDNADFVLTDFNSFSLMYDVFQHTFNYDNSYEVKLYTDLVEYDEGYYLELKGEYVDEPGIYHFVRSYYLTDVDDQGYVENMYNNVLRPSRMMIRTHNELVDLMTLPEIPLVTLTVIYQLLRIVFYYFVGIVLAVSVIIADSFGVLKALFICFLKLMGFVPINSFPGA